MKYIKKISKKDNKKKSFLAVIPARGNSKRIKNKNLFKLNNKPLIYWTIKSAVDSKFVSDVCVTSDSNKILNYCKKCIHVNSLFFSTIPKWTWTWFFMFCYYLMDVVF